MPADLAALLKLELPIIVQIGARLMPLGNVLAFRPGSIIELEKPADEEFEILVNNQPIGSGRAVKVGENYGIRISQAGERSARILAADSGDSPVTNSP